MKKSFQLSAPWRRSVLLALAATGLTSAGFAQLIYQEGFNTDGSVSSPPRYTFIGRDVYEVPRIQADLANYDQKGPLYWAHNVDTSYVGIPEFTPGRRMIFTWRGTDASTASEDVLALFDSSVAWLLAGKANAKIVVFPDVASIGGLADRLTAAGHTVEDDDITNIPDEQDVVADLMIHGPGASNASRFVLSAKPVIVMNSPDYDDMIVGSIGSAVTFNPAKVTITSAGHPAAGGKTGTFDGFTGDEQMEIVGSFLPTGSTTLATVSRVIPPSVQSLADVDAMIAGTKSHDQTAGTSADLDFSDASSGSWFSDNSIPGGYAGVWGLRATGKLSVATAGTYRIALGSDDGARLQIDLDKNGLTGADTVMDDPGPHGHQNVYANVVFPSSGAYDFEVRSYNSGGGGSLEVSVATEAGEVPDDALDSGYWELLGVAGAISPVTLQGIVNVTGYIATGPDVEVQTPLIVLLNGPNDVPKGTFYDGGAFSGFEGTGFVGASGLNKWTLPDEGYRAVRLNPVNVAGKSNVKLTIALAATQVDFETSDYMDVVVYPNGISSTPVTLAHFQGVVNAVQPWMADQKDNFIRRLTKQFADFTYDIPAGATDLVVEIRALTTWWTEIAAFDNIRISSGTATVPMGAITATASGDNLNLAWTGGTAPYLVQGKLQLDGPAWIDLQTVTGTSTSIPMAAFGGVFRVQDGATKTVKLFKAALNGANERPTPNTQPGTGVGLLALDGLNLTYVVSYQKLSAEPSAAHLHGLGTAEQVVNPLFFLEPAGTLGTSGIYIGTSTVDQATATGIGDSQTYFNIHTLGTFVGGEIRGQVVPVP